MKEIILDGKKLLQRETAQEYLMEQFSFPDYYGKNLDALYDCLGELYDVKVTVKNSQLCQEKYCYGKRIINVLKAAAEENAALTLEVKE